MFCRSSRSSFSWKVCDLGKTTRSESEDVDWERFRRYDSYLESEEMKINSQTYKKAGEEYIAGKYGKLSNLGRRICNCSG